MLPKAMSSASPKCAPATTPASLGVRRNATISPPKYAAAAKIVSSIGVVLIGISRLNTTRNIDTTSSILAAAPSKCPTGRPSSRAATTIAPTPVAVCSAAQ